MQIAQFKWVFKLIQGSQQAAILVLDFKNKCKHMWAKYPKHLLKIN